ncbi:MAG: hypothetical protein AAFX93_19825 [Verrucomicrobiota bacterium]
MLTLEQKLAIRGTMERIGLVDLGDYANHLDTVARRYEAKVNGLYGADDEAMAYSIRREAQAVREWQAHIDSLKATLVPASALLDAA